MLVISVISLIFSSLFQGISSNFIVYRFSNLSMFYTTYLILNFVVLLPYFENEKKYTILLIIFGLITDIAFTNTFILNTLLFIIIYKLNKLFFKVTPYNLLTINISSLFSIFVYNILTFIVLLAINYDSYSVGMLLTVITHSILMTIIYTTILYLLINYIYKFFQLRNVK